MLLSGGGLRPLPRPPPRTSRLYLGHLAYIAGKAAVANAYVVEAHILYDDDVRKKCWKLRKGYQAFGPGDDSEVSMIRYDTIHTKAFKACQQAAAAAAAPTAAANTGPNKGAFSNSNKT